MKFNGRVKSLGNTLMIEAPHNVCLPDGDYLIDIRETGKMKRSDRQNAMMWSIVNKICKKLDGNIYGSYDLYCQLLEMAGTTYYDYAIDDRALEDAKKLLKHVKVVHQDIQDGKITDYCWVFRGISEMDTHEASQLIDTVMMYASEVGVDVDDGYWKELLNGRT